MSFLIFCVFRNPRIKKNSHHHDEQMTTVATTSAPSPAALGITPGLYAYCYCEENVHRAVRRVLAASAAEASTARIEVFAVFISSYVQPDESVIVPGSWLSSSNIRLQTSPRTTDVIEWDYHVIMVVRIGGAALFVCDFDSQLCNGGKRGCVQQLVPFNVYCAVTFAQASAATCRFRVVPGAELVASFSSTRAHMMRPPMLSKWLADASRPLAPPSGMLSMPPGANAPILVAGEASRDLALFINTAPGGSAPGRVMSLSEFRDLSAASL